MTRRTLAILSLSIGLAACTRVAEPPPESREAVGKYFEAIRSARPRDALELFAPEAFETTSKDESETIMNRVAAKLGPLTSYTVEVDSVTRSSETSVAGIYTVFLCDVQYKNHKAVEAIRVFQADGGKAAVIVSYNINAPGVVLP